jgi:hypothetical protein
VGAGSEGSSAACAICISEFSPDDEVRLLPCSHYFHNRCVDEWLRINASCPTCRASILPDPENPVTPRYGTTGGPLDVPATARAGVAGAARPGGDHLV